MSATTPVAASTIRAHRDGDGDKQRFKTILLPFGNFGSNGGGGGISNFSTLTIAATPCQQLRGGVGGGIITPAR